MAFAEACPLDASELGAAIMKTLATCSASPSICAKAAALLGPTRLLSVLWASDAGVPVVSSNLLLAGLPAPSLTRARRNRAVQVTPLSTAGTSGAGCLASGSVAVEAMPVGFMLDGTSFKFEASSTIPVLSVPIPDLNRSHACVGAVSIELRASEDMDTRVPALKALAKALAPALSSLATSVASPALKCATGDCVSDASAASSLDSCSACSPKELPRADSDFEEALSQDSDSSSTESSGPLPLHLSVYKPFHEARRIRLEQDAALLSSPFQEHRRRILAASQSGPATALASATASSLASHAGEPAEAVTAQPMNAALAARSKGMVERLQLEATVTCPLQPEVSIAMPVTDAAMQATVDCGTSEPPPKRQALLMQSRGGSALTRTQPLYISGFHRYDDLVDSILASGEFDLDLSASSSLIGAQF